MKKLLSIILILAMLLSLVSCGPSKTISADNLGLIYKGFDIVEADKKVRFNTSLRVANTVEGKDNESYNVYYFMEDTYHLCGSYPLSTLKEGIDIGIEYTLSEKNDPEMYFVVSQQDAGKITDIEQCAKNLSNHFSFIYCKCPVELENKMGLTTEEYDGMLKAYGLEGKTWHEHPMKDADFEDNFLLAYLCGSWELDTESYNGVHPLWTKRLGSAGEFASVYPALLGEWLNCFDCNAYLGDDGRYYIFTNTEIPYYTKDELVSHVMETYHVAVKLHNQFVEYKIRKGVSTDMEIAQACYDFLVANADVPHNQISPAEQSYRESHPEMGNADFSRYIEQHTEASIVSLAADGAYNLLVNKRGDCGPHACLYNIMMNMEGFETYGLCGQAIGGGGHIVSYFVVGENAYLCDWNNKLGLCVINDAEKKLHFLPQKYSLDNVERTRFRNDLSNVGQEYTGEYYKW